MSRSEVIETLKKHDINGICVYTPEETYNLFKELKIAFPSNLIYTKTRYCEKPNDKPRVDGIDIIIYVCTYYNIEPDPEMIELSKKTIIERLKRELITKAYTR